MKKKQSSYDIIKSNRKLKLVFILLFLTFLLGVMIIYRYYLWSFLFALVFYIALLPVHDLFVKFLKNRTLSTVIIIILFLLIVIIPVSYVLAALSDQTVEMYNLLSKNFNYQSILDSIARNPVIDKVSSSFNYSETEKYLRITKFIQDTAQPVAARLKDLISFSINLPVNFFFMILILIFLLQEGHKYGSKIYDILPFPDDLVKQVFKRLKDVIKILIAGNFFIMLCQGILVGIGLKIAGIADYKLIAIIVAAVFSLIPVLGTVFVWGPVAVYLMINGQVLQAVIISVWCLTWYQVLENIVKPSLFGKKLKFHPLLFFFLLLGSLKTFGLSGVIIGPIILTVFYSLWEIYNLIDIYDTKKLEKI
ncbi:MAG: AI-2E family transporter [Spirochaetes bacterium]|nr:AI-2E family transporter [Spirochaetota bacterium]